MVSVAGSPCWPLTCVCSSATFASAAVEPRSGAITGGPHQSANTVKLIDYKQLVQSHARDTPPSSCCCRCMCRRNTSNEPGWHCSEDNTCGRPAAVETQQALPMPATKKSEPDAIVDVIFIHGRVMVRARRCVVPLPGSRTWCGCTAAHCSPHHCQCCSRLACKCRQVCQQR